MSGASVAVTQNAYARTYSGVDMLTIMQTEKSIKKHAYEYYKEKKYIYENIIKH